MGEACKCRFGNGLSTSKPLKSKTALKTKSSLKHRSPTSKRGKEQAQRSEFNQLVIERAKGRCEAGPYLFVYDPKIGGQCGRIGIDVHEIKSRARGGDILSLDNTMLCCRYCHDFITTHPVIAERLGFSKASWAD